MPTQLTREQLVLLAVHMAGDKGISSARLDIAIFLLQEQCDIEVTDGKFVFDFPPTVEEAIALAQEEV